MEFGVVLAVFVQGLDYIFAYLLSVLEGHFSVDLIHRMISLLLGRLKLSLLWLLLNLRNHFLRFWSKFIPLLLNVLFKIKRRMF
jgi:hypothetical protein